MKLNPDLVRDLLLAIEAVTDADTSFVYGKNLPTPENLREYTHDEIRYHLKQCEMAELIVNYRRYDGGDLVRVGDLSPEGHKFLANVRQDNIWNNTKQIAAKIGSKSMDTLVQISSNVITELIKAQFGLT